MCVHILKYILEEYIGKDLDICYRRMLLMSGIVSSSNLSPCRMILQSELTIQKKWEIPSNPSLPFTVFLIIICFLTRGLLKPVETSL